MGIETSGQQSEPTGSWEPTSKAPEVHRVDSLLTKGCEVRGDHHVFPREYSRGKTKIGKLIAEDGTEWFPICSPVAGEKAAERRRSLNTKITYVCEAASKKSGLPPWRHAGVPMGTFKEWEKDRNFFYWPPDDTSAAIEERMRLDGCASIHRATSTDNREDLLSAIGEAVMEGYRLYRLAAAAHGVVHPG